MKKYIVHIYYSLPIQLLLLHLRKYQLLLVFWYILFAIVNGSFMQNFGVDNLFLAPEYLDKLSVLSTALEGFAVAIFMMSWNITTFILHHQHIQFLATTTQPFLKYCINNAVLPIGFLIFYAFKAFSYQHFQQLFSVGQIIWLVLGFIIGFALSVAFAFGYFFGADKTIYKFLSADVKDELLKQKTNFEQVAAQKTNGSIKVLWYLNATFKIRRPRDVRHYTTAFLEKIFKQHHLAAMLSILVAFLGLIAIGFFLDNPYFQIPASASITLLFAILIAVAGAVSYFLKAWALPFAMLAILFANWLYFNGVIDPRNKAFGLNYTNIQDRPSYTYAALQALSCEQNIKADSLNYIGILNKWLQKQPTQKPTMFVISTSGGGTRSATFCLSVLQKLDSVLHGKLMDKTLLITGASGGLIGATYYRELFAQNKAGNPLNRNAEKYVNDIAKDLMNPLFSSFVVRDLISPAHYFTMSGYRYVKDRGYAMEEKLNDNTGGWLNKQLKDEVDGEKNAIFPLLFFNSVITADGRKMTIATQPSRFMMRQRVDTTQALLPGPDAVDFVSFFAKQNPYNLRLLTALRMNATFPYVLPNVWLPTNPVVDVMDAGFRDNTGVETALRFIFFFKQWIKENCGNVVLLQIRDKKEGGWEKQYQSKNVFDLVAKPALLTQANLFRFQEYAQLTGLAYFQQVMGKQFQRLVFEYMPANKNFAAPLSFHLSQREKNDIKASLNKQEEVFKMVSSFQ